MTEEKVAEKTRPWHWPGEWLRDEAFWKDVASRTLATVFAAGLVFLFALGAGYVSSPTVTDVLKGLAIALGPPILAVVVGLSVGLVWGRYAKGRTWMSWAAICVGVVLIVWAICAMGWALYRSFE